MNIYMYRENLTITECIQQHACTPVPCTLMMHTGCHVQQVCVCVCVFVCVCVCGGGGAYLERHVITLCPAPQWVEQQHRLGVATGKNHLPSVLHWRGRA